MDLFGEILEECGVLNEKTYKKKRKKNLKPQKKHKVLKVSKNNNNPSSNISMSNTQTFVNDINDAIDNMYPVIMNYNSGGKMKKVIDYKLLYLILQQLLQILKIL